MVDYYYAAIRLEPSYNEKIMSVDKMLYVGQSANGMSTGTHYVNSRNSSCLKTIYGNNYFEILHEGTGYTNKFKLIKNLITGYFENNDLKFEKRVIDVIKQNNINKVFLGHAFYGKLARKLRMTFGDSIVIYTFMHNIETDVARQAINKRTSLRSLYGLRIARYNEPLSIKYSDKIILLNERDNALLNNRYGLQKTILLPITFEIIPFCERQERNFEVLNLLFVGSKFPPNQQGIEWFIKHVMPLLPDNVCLYVVGREMEYLQSEVQLPPSVKAIGGVNDLAEWYRKADIVICPIFEGGGMKTKTAEAMQHGKPILGTKESFEGYNVDFSRIGGVCETPESYVTSISGFLNDRELLSKCSRYSYDVFCEQFSNQVAIDILKNNKV